MSAGAVAMLVFGALTLYGGLAVCLVIAWRARPSSGGPRSSADGEHASDAETGLHRQGSPPPTDAT